MKKVKCIVDDELSLTKGKIYEVMDEEHGLWAVVDDEDEGAYCIIVACLTIIILVV